jgi:PadR family transcriptional regulator, regulatory protein PadR
MRAGLWDRGVGPVFSTAFDEGRGRGIDDVGVRSVMRYGQPKKASGRVMGLANQAAQRYSLQRSFGGRGGIFPTLSSKTDGEDRMLGRFEEAVLMALFSGGEATIADIYQVLADHKMARALGAIYTVLDRMIAKKFVTRRKGDSLPERGGKARYYYKITGGGRAAVMEAQKAAALWHGAQAV